MKTHICFPSATRTAETDPGAIRTHHPPSQLASCRNLPLGAPDVLEEAVALGEAVQGIVALAHGADETGQGVDDVLALDGPAVLVDLGDGDLAGAVVLGLDDAARRRALAGDVTVGGGTLESVRSLSGRGRAIVVVGQQGGLTGRRFHHGRSPFWRLVDECCEMTDSGVRWGAGEQDCEISRESLNFHQIC